MNPFRSAASQIGFEGRTLAADGGLWACPMEQRFAVPHGPHDGFHLQSLEPIQDGRNDYEKPYIVGGISAFARARANVPLEIEGAALFDGNDCLPPWREKARINYIAGNYALRAVSFAGGLPEIPVPLLYPNTVDLAGKHTLVAGSSLTPLEQVYEGGSPTDLFLSMRLNRPVAGEEIWAAKKEGEHFSTLTNVALGVRWNLRFLPSRVPCDELTFNANRCTCSPEEPIEARASPDAFGAFLSERGIVTQARMPSHSCMRENAANPSHTYLVPGIYVPERGWFSHNGREYEVKYVFAEERGAANPKLLSAELRLAGSSDLIERVSFDYRGFPNPADPHGALLLAKVESSLDPSRSIHFDEYETREFDIGGYQSRSYLLKKVRRGTETAGPTAEGLEFDYRAIGTTAVATERVKNIQGTKLFDYIYGTIDAARNLSGVVAIRDSDGLETRLDFEDVHPPGAPDGGKELVLTNPNGSRDWYTYSGSQIAKAGKVGCGRPLLERSWAQFGSPGNTEWLLDSESYAQTCDAADPAVKLKYHYDDLNRLVKVGRGMSDQDPSAFATIWEALEYAELRPTNSGPSFEPTSWKEGPATLSLTYDRQGRPDIFTTPLNRYNFDFSGNQQTVTDAGGVRLELTLDSRGNPTRIEKNPGTRDAHATVLGYDKGRLNSIESPEGEFGINYFNGLPLQSTATGPDGVTVTQSFFPASDGLRLASVETEYEKGGARKEAVSFEKSGNQLTIKLSAPDILGALNLGTVTYNSNGTIQSIARPGEPTLALGYVQSGPHKGEVSGVTWPGASVTFDNSQRMADGTPLKVTTSGGGLQCTETTQLDSWGVQKVENSCNDGRPSTGVVVASRDLYGQPTLVSDLLNNIPSKTYEVVERHVSGIVTKLKELNSGVERILALSGGNRKLVESLTYSIPEVSSPGGSGDSPSGAGSGPVALGRPGGNPVGVGDGASWERSITWLFQNPNSAGKPQRIVKNDSAKPSPVSVDISYKPSGEPSTIRRNDGLQFSNPSYGTTIFQAPGGIYQKFVTAFGVSSDGKMTETTSEYVQGGSDSAPAGGGSEGLSRPGGPGGTGGVAHGLSLRSSVTSTYGSFDYRVENHQNGCQLVSETDPNGTAYTSSQTCPGMSPVTDELTRAPSEGGGYRFTLTRNDTPVEEFSTGVLGDLRSFTLVGTSDVGSQTWNLGFTTAGRYVDLPDGRQLSSSIQVTEAAIKETVVAPEGSTEYLTMHSGAAGRMTRSRGDGSEVFAWTSSGGFLNYLSWRGSDAGGTAASQTITFNHSPGELRVTDEKTHTRVHSEGGAPFTVASSEESTLRTPSPGMVVINGTTYISDALGRLQSVTNHDGQELVRYNYGPLGSPVERVVGGGRLKQVFYPDPQNPGSFSRVETFFQESGGGHTRILDGVRTRNQNVVTSDLTGSAGLAGLRFTTRYDFNNPHGLLRGIFRSVTPTGTLPPAESEFNCDQGWGGLCSADGWIPRSPDGSLPGFTYTPDGRAVTELGNSGATTYEWLGDKLYSMTDPSGEKTVAAPGLSGPSFVYKDGKRYEYGLDGLRVISCPAGRTDC